MPFRIDSTSKGGFHRALAALSQSFVANPVTFLSFPVSDPKGLGKKGCNPNLGGHDSVFSKFFNHEQPPSGILHVIKVLLTLVFQAQRLDV